MQRRDFLRLVGATAAATAIAPSSVVQAESDPVLRTLYPLQHQEGSWITVYVLPSPAEKRSRAQIMLPDVASTSTYAYVTGVRCGNDPQQVVIESMAVRGLDVLSAPVDAALFNTQELYCPIDAGAVQRGKPLHIDYESFGRADDQFLLLALFYEVRDVDEYRPPGSPIYGVRPWPSRAHE